MRKIAFSMDENKGTDQLPGYSAVDQCRCFRYIDRTIPTLPKSEILSI